MMLSSTLSAGGRERQVFSLIKALAQKKNIEIVFVLLFNDIFFEEIYNLPINIRILNVKSTKDITIFKKYKKLFKEEKPNVIHAWDEYVAFYALPISAILKIKFINGSLRHGIFQFKIRQIIRNITYRFSPYIIANSYAGYKANGLHINKKRFVLYNGIDEKFNKQNLQSISKREFLENNGIQFNSELIFLSVSRLDPYKDYFTILDALSKLKVEGIKFKYLIVGDGPTGESIEYYIRKKVLKGEIYLVGKQKNIEDYYNIADIFIHSSKGEGCW